MAITIGIYGAYSQGNFGDDLMALICANEVLKAGQSPLVYGLSEKACSLQGCQVTHDLNEFLAKSNKFIYGGGGLLTVKRVTSDFQMAMRSEIKKIIKHASEYSKEIGVFSIGSNGDLSVLPVDYAMGIASAASVATVRLNVDQSWPFMPISTESYPDIVLSIKSCLSTSFVQPLYKSPRIRVAINISKRLGYLSIPILLILSYARNFDVIYVAAHSRERGFGSDFQLPVLITKLFKRLENIRIENSLLALSEISSWDVIISSKLHVGVAAMALGATFFPNSNNAKVYSFFCDIGVTSTCWQGALGFFTALFRLPYHRFNDKEWLAIENAAKDSRSHLDAIRSFVA
jgi:hypothetical protein